MKIYKYIHSCILVEEQGRGILFDPGIFSFMDGQVKPDKFFDLDAVLITHGHGDHLDVETVKAIMANNPRAVVLSNKQVVERLHKAGVPATIFEVGSLQTGDFTIEAVPAPHERTILADSFPDHVAFRINQRLIHPGDSLSIETMAPWAGTEMLLFPATAPWMNERQAYDFVTAMKPQLTVPIHDGYLKPFFQQARYRNYADFFKREDITLIPLAEVGQAYELPQAELAT